jgi:alpha-L-fucosidase 2
MIPPMKFSRFPIPLALLASAGPLSAGVLWSDQPVVFPENVKGDMRQETQHWEKNVYPIGNGRLGGTLFGDPQAERLQFNEDSMWVGNEDNTGGYQPFGDVHVELNHNAFTHYRRELDLRNAVHTVTYTSGGVNYKRVAFSSNPAQVIVLHFTADQPGSHTGKVWMGNLHEIATTASGNTLTMKGNTEPLFFWQLQLKEREKRLLADRQYASDQIIDLDFEAQARVLHQGGAIRTEGNTIHFENCDSLTILLAADTNYLNRRDKGWRTGHPHQRLTAQLAAAEKRPHADLLEEHVADYQKLYRRFSIDLGAPPETAAKLPTAVRRGIYQKEFSSGRMPADRGLEALMYQYARYLMIASSRPGEGALPANLQGLWLYNLRPAWRCDYHTDINLQMNYWFTGPSNLHECFIPLAEWIDSIREVRKEETRKVLGVERGWLMRSENGVFGGSTWHIQKGDSAWLCQNLWDHYLFTQDKEFLKRYAYPVMKEISEFWVDHLKELPDGTLVAPKGRSPEHGPVDVDGVTYDQALCWDLFTNTIEAGGVLGVDAQHLRKLSAMREKLLGPKIGRWGQLQEWMEDIDDPKDDHRHNNHLIGVHPGRQIHPATTPEWAEAAKVSVIARGNGPTGWSKIWKSCIFARLLEAERAHHLVADVIATKCYANLWATHPPFQIDCNFGYAAAVNEMLVQSHMGYVHLLPALPAAWPEGQVRGMRLRGGFELDMTWKDAKLTHAQIRNVSGIDGKCEVRYKDKAHLLEIPRGGSVSLP